MLARIKLLLSALALVALAAPALGDVTLVSNVTDLTWVDSGGASSSESGGDTLLIDTSKNSAVTASLPSAVAIPATGDFLTVTFEVTFDNVPTETSSSFGIGFGDSSTGGYFYQVSINPLAAPSGSGVVFAEGGDTNLGKYESLGFGTTAHTVAFTVTNVDNGADLDLTAASDVISGSPRTVGLDITPATTTTLDTVYFNFRGNAWNEEFDGDPIQATITNFSVTSNIPEPGSLGLTLLGLLCLVPRRRSAT